LPIGYLLAHLCRDELVDGRKWFIILIIISAIVGIILLIANRNFPIILTLLYIIITSFISFILSYNKKFVRGR